ncbi:MAG TPA: vitamin K epoxide reductase family protein, partial [Mucilaginibacter sp.]
MSIKKKYDNTIITVIQLIRELSLPITNTTLTTELELHPNFPSLLAISDVLSQYNIANYPFSNITFEQLKTIPCPFIAHTNTRGDEFVVVKEINEHEIIFSNKSLSIDLFTKRFDGTILIIEPLADAGDPNYKQNRWQQLLNSLRNPVAIIGLLIAAILALLFHSSYFNGFNWQVAAITLFKLAGLTTTILLLIQSIDANNPLIQILCQSDTNKNCSAILASKSAKVFEGLTWSEVGFFYFAGTFLTFLFNSNSIGLLQILAILNILSLPYTFYSIYHQAFIAKQWCVLCCTIQALLWLEFIPLILTLNQPFVLPGIHELSSLFICFIIPFALWIWVKPVLLDAEKIQPLNK